MTESLAELKTTQEEQADLVRRYVDEYAALALEADRIKQRMDWLKGRGQAEAVLVGSDPETDLALIKISGESGLPFIGSIVAHRNGGCSVKGSCL